MSLAARYATKLLWMKNGEIVCESTPRDTLSPKNLADVYDVHAEVSGLDVRLLNALTRLRLLNKPKFKWSALRRALNRMSVCC